LWHPRTKDQRPRQRYQTGRIPPDSRDPSLCAIFRVIDTACLYGSLRETSCRRRVSPPSVVAARERRAHRGRGPWDLACADQNASAGLSLLDETCFAQGTDLSIETSLGLNIAVTTIFEPSSE
jgi:hypothetical protein